MSANASASVTSIPPNETSTHESLIAVSASLIALTIIAVALRFLSRRLQRLAYKADDWVLLPTLLLFVGNSAIAIAAATRHLLGYPDFHENQTKIFYACSTVTYLEQGLVKISALLFYHRAFCPPGYNTRLRSYLVCMVAVVVAWTLAFFLVQVAGCRHLSYFWSTDTKLIAQCAPLLDDLAVAQAVTDAALEIIVLISPIPKIITLNTSVARRAGIAAVFLVALASVGASLARLALYAKGEAAIHSVAVSDTINPSFFNTSATWYGIFESGIALIAVNIPSIYWLWNGTSPEKFLGSIRSAVSLSSLRSRSSRDQEKNIAAAAEARARNAAASQQLRGHQAVSDIKSTVSTRADPNQSDGNDFAEELPTDRIQVVQTVHQSTI